MMAAIHNKITRITTKNTTHNEPLPLEEFSNPEVFALEDESVADPLGDEVLLVLVLPVVGDGGRVPKV